MNSLTLVSDFNIDILRRYLSNIPDLSGITIQTAAYGQVYQNLLAPKDVDQKEDALFVWVSPESVLKSFNYVLCYRPSDHDAVLTELENYIDAIRNKASSVKYLFLASWTMPVGERGYGMLDYTNGLGIASLISRLNVRMSERLADCSNVFMLNCESWIRSAGPRAASAKMWFASKVPYSNTVFQEAANDLAAALQGLAGKARKLIIVDLDNTLWGGVVGETGWEGLRLGGHDHVGEAFVHFQKRLKALSERGVQLAIVSKNDESTALEALDKHPEMLLRREDFAAWRINWSDKARNIVDLLDELRLGLDAVVFLDDNPAERGRVRDALGDQVLVPEWPADPAEYGNALSALKCFDTPAVSQEDRARASMYASERKRTESRKKIGSLDSWLESLEMQVAVEQLSESNLPRTAQLLNKTNQMNMRTRRMSEQELKGWTDQGERALWTFRLSDCYGDLGLCGVISIEIEQESAHIVDFVMSCRVMGRSLEELMIHTVAESVRQKHGPIHLVAEYLETERNRPCLDFWENSGFEERRPHEFVWDLAKAYPMPRVFNVTEIAA